MSNRMRRREFFAKCGAGVGALAVPYILPSGALSQPSPNEATVRAFIGVGGRGRALEREVLRRLRDTGDVRVAAVCDVDENHLAAALKMAKDAGAESCQAYSDYREILDRDDIDVVYCHTAPLARFDLYPRRSGRKGHLLREADDQVHP